MGFSESFSTLFEMFIFFQDKSEDLLRFTVQDYF